MQLQQ